MVQPLIQGLFQVRGSLPPPEAPLGVPFAEGLARHVGAAWRAASAAPVAVARDEGALCLAWGRPRFREPALARCAREHGTAAAWLRAWASHGDGAPAQAAGRFAVVLLDEARRRCCAAVDRFASLPLCHASEGGGFAFSDRADCVPGAARPLATQALHDYLFFHHLPAPDTVFRGVARLPAGHCLVADAHGVRVSAWWTPVFEEPREADFPARRREFLALLEAAVAREADSGEPAAFLSGGTDSSTVAGMLGRALGRPAHCYSIGFAADGYDEMAYARIAARHFGCEHHAHYLTPDEVAAGIPEVAAHFDQPFGNSSALPAWICARQARADGIDKLLAGDGGDELFGGNTRYARQRLFECYHALPALLARRVIEPALALPGVARLPLLGKGARYVAQARVPLPERAELYNLLHRLGPETVFTPDFLARIDPLHPARQQRATWRAVRAASLINRMLAFDWKYTLADNDLPKVVGATTLAGLEVGFPLLADELVDFSLRLPPHWKLRGFTLRWFFKEALRGFLPEAILAKKKHGFGLPFGVWALQHPALRAQAGTALAAFATRGIVREDFCARLMRELLPAHPGYYGEMVWLLVMLEHWLAAHPLGAAQRAPAVAAA